MEEPPTKKIKVLNEDCSTNSISIEIIPKEVLCIIFSYLDRKSVKNVTATCKLWFEIIRGDSKRSSHVCLSCMSLHELDTRIADLDFTLSRWPVLKTIEFRGYYYSYIYYMGISVLNKILKYTRRLVNSEDCPSLEKIIVTDSYNLGRVFPQLPNFGTIEEFTFSPTAEMNRQIQIEHITNLNLEFYLEGDEGKKVSDGLKLIGESACNLEEITITFKSCFEEQHMIESFKVEFCQMLKQMTLLKRIPINVPSLCYVETLFPDLEELTDLFVASTKFDELKSYNLAKIGLKFIKLRQLQIQVRLVRALTTEEEHWKRIKLPSIVDKIFQDITEVKIVFYRPTDLNGNIETFFTVTKMPHHTTKTSDIREGPRPMKYTISN